MTTTTNISVFNVTKISSRCFADLPSAPLFISMEGNDWTGGISEICIHTGNAKLAEALVKAINNAVATVAEVTAKEVEVA